MDSQMDHRFSKQESEGALNRYAAIMLEIKRRHAVLSNACEPCKEFGINPRLEIGFLQIRKISELIALSTITAHFVLVKQKPSIAKQYRPSDIMRDLEKLHADFYPQPVEPVPNERAVAGFDLLPISQPFLTRKDVITAWDRSGDMLHVGKIANWKEPREKAEVSELQEFSLRLVNLLRHHVIIHRGRRSMVEVQMNGGIEALPIVVLRAAMDENDNVLGIYEGDA